MQENIGNLFQTEASHGSLSREVAIAVWVGMPLMLGCKGLVSHVIRRACWRKEVSVLTVSRVEVLLLLGASFSEKFPKLMRGTGVPFGFPVSILSGDAGRPRGWRPSRRCYNFKRWVSI